MKSRLILIAAAVFGVITTGGMLPAEAASPFVPDPSDLIDPTAHYKDYNTPFPLLKVKLKAVKGDPVTIADVNTDIDSDDDFVPEMMVHFAADDYPDDASTDNAKLRMRGSSSRLGAQKSYRVKLNKGTTPWRNETTLQLNKHPWDLARIRNKLAFDFFCDIPHLSSLRTQFVHLTFDDDGDPVTPDVDYGLFTHVEKMGKEYLVNRGWSTSSNIYKAEDFIFRTDSRLDLKTDSTPVNTVDFERVLSIENGTSHSTLLQMISAIDSTSNNFNTEFTKYFNRNNYLTWLALNLLTGNRDTRTQNFALLQLAGTTRFYLLPWDYDGAFGYERQPDVAAVGTLYAGWQLGLSNYWGIPLHERFLQEPGNLKDLEAAVEELRSLYLGNNKVQSKIDNYKPLVEELITNDPDLANLQTLSQDPVERRLEWSAEYQRLAATVEDNYNEFRQRLEKPMPFWQAANPDVGKLLLTWDQSVDLQGDAVTYQVSIARHADFSAGSVVLEADGISGTSLETDLLPNGTYYMKVLAKDAKGKTQEGFDRTDEAGKAYFGVMKFNLTANGTCGSSQGGTFNTVPESNLCDTGTASVVSSTSTGPWIWSCVGSDNWAVSSCSALQTYPLSVALGGAGGGSVRGNLSCLKGNVCPPVPVVAGTQVTLIQQADSGSLFGGWSAACNNNSSPGECSFVMDGPKTVTATFDAAPKVTVGAKGFSGFLSAYNDAGTDSNAIIKLLEGTLAENVICDRNIAVRLEGGYNASFNAINTETAIVGRLEIRAGTVVISGVSLR